MLPLHSLGERIVVLGPSNAGKSTLAVALSKNLAFQRSISISFIICPIPIGNSALKRNSLRFATRPFFATSGSWKAIIRA